MATLAWFWYKCQLFRSIVFIKEIEFLCPCDAHLPFPLDPPLSSFPLFSQQLLPQSPLSTSWKRAEKTWKGTKTISTEKDGTKAEAPTTKWKNLASTNICISAILSGSALQGVEETSFLTLYPISHPPPLYITNNPIIRVEICRDRGRVKFVPAVKIPENNTISCIICLERHKSFLFLHWNCWNLIHSVNSNKKWLKLLILMLLPCFMVSENSRNLRTFSV